jgi:hypothetical protein
MQYTPQEIDEKFTPRRYLWWLHLASIAVITTASGTAAILLLEETPPWQWLVFAGFIVGLNFGEYWIHRWPFHITKKPHAFYFRHTILHHALYTHETMGIRNTRELHHVALPVWGFPAILAFLSPVFFSFFFWMPNLSWLFLLATACYYAVYETSHTLSHLPDSSALSKNSLIRALSHHHRIHHDPALMTRYNFNFALPIFDILLRTRHRKPAEQ